MTRTSNQPFTRREALAAGVSVGQLAGPRYQRLFHGVYLPAQVHATVLHRARAALKISAPGTYASHHTAAAIWGGWIPHSPETHISVPAGSSRSKRRGIQAHRASTSAIVVEHRGVLVSPPLQTFLELAGDRLDFVDLVIFGDSLVKQKRTTLEELRTTASTWVGPGAAVARRAARLVRDGVDSPPETRLRLLIVLAGLPEPEVNVVTRLEGGAWHRRFDLCYPELKIIIEYDGRHHASELAQWSADILRREELESLGWRMIIVNAEALYHHPSDTLRRITVALRSRRAENLRYRLPSVWSRHFHDRSEAA